MERRTLHEITREADIALLAILDYWTQYEANTVLFTIAELRRRRVSLNEDMCSRIEAFCAFHKIDSFDSRLSQVLRRLGYFSYEEYFTDQIVEPQRQAAQYHAQHGNHPAAAPAQVQHHSLRFLRVLYILLGWFLLGIIALLVLVLSKIALTFALFALAIGTLFVVAIFAQARFISVLAAME